MYRVQSLKEWLNEERDRAFNQYARVLGREPSPESERRRAVVQKFDEAKKRKENLTPEEIEDLKKTVEDIDREDDARADTAARESMAKWIRSENAQKTEQGKQQEAKPEQVDVTEQKEEQPGRRGPLKDEATELGVLLLRKLGKEKIEEILAVACPLDPEYRRTVGQAQADAVDRIRKNILQAYRRDSK